MNPEELAQWLMRRFVIGGIDCTNDDLREEWRVYGERWRAVADALMTEYALRRRAKKDGGKP